MVVLSIAACVSVSVTSLSSFTSEEGRFTIVVPGGTMSEQNSDGTGHYAGSTIHAFVHDEPDGLRFALFYGGATDGYPDSIGIDAALAEVEAANINATSGTQSAERSLTISGYSGREQRIQSATAGYVFRMVFVGSRLYLFSAKGTVTQVANAMVITYLDSFMVLP